MTNQHVKHSLILSLRIEKVAKRCLKTQQRDDKEKNDYKLQISEFHHSLQITLTIVHYV